MDHVEITRSDLIGPSGRSIVACVAQFRWSEPVERCI